MHILASHDRSEFLATPGLIRFEHAQGRNGPEPTFLIKSTTLMLKYIVQGAALQLVFSRLGDRLLYALRVIDDEKKPASVWSILEHDAEKAGLNALAQGEACQIFLFNELAVNVAWTSLSMSAHPDLADVVAGVATGPVDQAAFERDASTVFDRVFNNPVSDTDLLVIDLPAATKWEPILNHFITSHATDSPIDLFSNNEGSQQEQLAVWLTDSLQPLGVHHEPQIPQGSGFQELTDILLSYQFGSVLIESKTLAIFVRQSLPNRTKLAKNISRHIKKAVNQLRRGIQQIKEGRPITSKSGATLSVERSQPAHGIILIPDLDLIEDPETYGPEFIKEFIEATGGFIHLLDIAELLRIVQAAEMIAERGAITTPMMAFDYYLIERVKKTLDAGTLRIRVLLRFVDE